MIFDLFPETKMDVFILTNLATRVVLNPFISNRKNIQQYMWCDQNILRLKLSIFQISKFRIQIQNENVCTPGLIWFGLVLWHINHSRLFQAKFSLDIYIKTI